MVLAGTNATQAQVAEAVRVNTEARLRALKIGLLIMAGLALLAIIPAGRLPNYLPGTVPDDPFLKDPVEGPAGLWAASATRADAARHGGG